MQYKYNRNRQQITMSLIIIDMFTTYTVHICIIPDNIIYINNIINIQIK